MSQKMGLKASRMTAAQRQVLATELLAKMQARFPLVRIEKLKDVAEKDSFSSLELVMGVSPDSNTFNSVKDQVLKDVCTGESASTETKLYMQHGEFQVEVQFVEPSHFDMCVDYESYQELGRLISKSVHVQGMSLSHKGLFYRVRAGSRMVTDIELANSWSHALSILGYSHARWEQGFKSLEDVFAFVASSPVFLASCFAVKPSETGSRQALRFVFAEWLEKHSVVDSEVAALTWLFERVPGFELRYNTIQAADKKRYG